MTSLVWKNITAYYVNSTLLILFTDYNYDTIFTATGLYYVLIIYQVMTIFIGLIAEIFDFVYIWNRYKKHVNLQKLNNEEFLTQKKLNQCHGLVNFQIENPVQTVYKSMGISLFFSFIFPLSPLCSFFELAISYWVQKY